MCYHKCLEKRKFVGLNMIDVIIDLESCVEAEDTQIMNVSSVGQMRLENDCCRLYYDEEDAEGNKVKTIIKVEGEYVMIQRQGGSDSCLIVKQGERFSSPYNTGYGMLNVGIKGNRVESNIDENGGKIELEYDLDINSDYVSKNVIKINIRRI